MAVIDTFRVVVPYYAAVANGTVTSLLASTTLRLSVNGWGNVYEEALSYLTAHRMYLMGYRSDGTVSLGEMDAKADAAGPAVSKSAGDVSEGYTASPRNVPITTEDGYLMLTRFGQEFLQLRNSRSMAHINVVDVNG